MFFSSSRSTESRWRAASSSRFSCCSARSASSSAALQLEFQTGPDIFELLLILGQRGEVPHGILQILLCVVPLDSQHLGSFFQRRQTAQGRLSSSLGGGLSHLHIGLNGGHGLQLAPQRIPAATSLIILTFQSLKLLVQ